MQVTCVGVAGAYSRSRSPVFTAHTDRAPLADRDRHAGAATPDSNTTETNEDEDDEDRHVNTHPPSWKI
jgi:hypothetical protein